MYLYAFVKNIGDDLKSNDLKDLNDKQSVSRSVKESAVKASSSMVTLEKTVSGLPLGGIDFRSMNMLVQPAGSFTGLDFSLPMLSKDEIESFDLDKEIIAIRNMVREGLSPPAKGSRNT